MTFTVANILTLSRLCLTPFFLICFIGEIKDLAFIIFCVAGFTDLIDGSVARLLKQHSKGGALLDPIADKLLMQTCYSALFFTGIIPMWFFLLALVRDITIITGIIYLEVKKAKLPYRPIWTSKIATLFQLLVAVVGLLRWWKPMLSVGGFDVFHVLLILIFVTAILLILSGTQYVMMGFDLLRRRNLEEDDEDSEDA